MPVPVPSPENQEPRRLLRDVVYDKMFYAILDGTLELGERLNDEELVRWLGVSRTPVREAIAKLAEQGLVDIEANRYTRVVSPSYAEFLDIVQAGYDVWALCNRRGVDKLSAADRDWIVGELDTRAAQFKAGKTESLPSFDEILVRILNAAESPMLWRLRAVTGPIATLLMQRAAVAGFYPWEQAQSMTTALRDAVKAGDAERAAAVVAEQPAKFDAFFAEVKASGLYPA